MPFTPFHFGPGGAIHVLAPRRTSFLAFCVSNVFTDCETLYFIITRQYPLHRFFHTYIGAAVMALMTLLLFVVAKSLARPLRLPNVLKWRDLTMLPVALGASVGTLSHVLLDSIMHPDVRPFAPFTDANPLLHVVPLELLHLACVLAGVAAVGVVLARLKARHS
jgi:membrane-bound metal-dependent hydrolase YbcI (DUF457 family)